MIYLFFYILLGIALFGPLTFISYVYVDDETFKKIKYVIPLFIILWPVVALMVVGLFVFFSYQIFLHKK